MGQLRAIEGIQGSLRKLSALPIQERLSGFLGTAADALADRSRKAATYGSDATSEAAESLPPPYAFLQFDISQLA